MNLLLIIASQDYSQANHQGLWNALSQQADTDVVVLNIPADYVVSVLRRKQSRIKEAKEGIQRVSEHLYVLRPLLSIRPDILPDCFFSLIKKQFWSNIKKSIPRLSEYNCILVLSYDAMWIKVLAHSPYDIKIAYYLYDEVRNNGEDNSVDKRRYRLDEYACKSAHCVFTMTDRLTESRKEYNDHIITVGNGAVYDSKPEREEGYAFPKSVAFIGNFRNWIDKQLLSELISLRRDILFGFVGNVEEDMTFYFSQLLNTNLNTVYLGKCQKSDMKHVYRMFSAVMVPYRQNPFMQATRPIKIVESIFAGIPVVTVPMDGYKEGEFVRFAHTAKEFSEQIDYLLQNPIDVHSSAYIQFVNENSWANIANIFIGELSK